MQTPYALVVCAGLVVVGCSGTQNSTVETPPLGQLIAEGKPLPPDIKPQTLVESGESAIYELARANRAKDLEAMIRHSPICKDQVSKSGRPIIGALKGHAKEVVDLLFASGADMETSSESTPPPLIVCIKTAPEFIGQFARYKVNPNARWASETALHEAVINGQLKCITTLLKMGANPKATDRNGETPLQVAKRLGNRTAENLLTP